MENDVHRTVRFAADHGEMTEWIPALFWLPERLERHVHDLMLSENVRIIYVNNFILKRACNRNRITIEQAGRIIGHGKTSFSGISTGRVGITVAEAAVLADRLGCSIQELTDIDSVYIYDTRAGRVVLTGLTPEGKERLKEAYWVTEGMEQNLLRKYALYYTEYIGLHEWLIQFEALAELYQIALPTRSQLYRLHQRMKDLLDETPGLQWPKEGRRYRDKKDHNPGRSRKKDSSRKKEHHR